LIASVAVLVGSLLLLAFVGTMGFLDSTKGGVPLWLVVLGVFAVLGVALGFGGFFLMMLTAWWRSHREARRVQVIPPEHHGSKVE
jgi:protein-S-isoprenylcysteine O-methyltransferase Ste14